MGVKRIIVPVSSLEEAVRGLSQRYEVLKIYLPGSPEHASAGLREDHALIRAMKKKGGEKMKREEEESYEQWQRRLIKTLELIERFEEELRKFSQDRDFEEYKEEAIKGLEAIQTLKRVMEGFIPP